MKNKSQLKQIKEHLQWYDTITSTKDLGTELEEIAINFYNQDNEESKVDDYTKIDTKDSEDIPF